MAWTLGGHTSATGTTSGVDTTGATFITLYVCDQPITPTDSKGNTWMPVTPQTQGATTGGWFYCVNPSVGAGHTFSAPHSYGAIAARWYTGNTSTPFDVQSGHVVAISTSVAPGSITPTQNNDLLLAGLGTGSGNTTLYGISGGGFSTVSDSVNGLTGVTYGLATSEVIQTTASASSPTWTWTGAADGVTTIVAFFASAGGGVTVRTLAALGVG
jgi:hypothetical protein